jgi:hypothetical protein
VTLVKRTLRFDIYPKATPTSGRLAQLARPLAGSGLRVELNGTGSGTIVIDRNDAQCTAANFSDGNYVDVVDTILNKSLGGFFMPAGTTKLLSHNEKGDQILTVSGPGTLSYVGKDEWLPVAYISADPGGTGIGNATNSPRSDGLWHWPNNKYGSILERAILEGQDPDRPDNEIPAIVLDFSYQTDSAGASFTSYTGDYTQAIGTNYLDTVADVIRLGLTVLMKPNFHLQCYQGQYGTDRHSATFASGKVRFVGGVNIAADLERSLHPNMRVKTLVVQGQSSLPADFVIVQDSGGSGEAFMQYGLTDDPAVLTDAGNKNLSLRQAATDMARFPILAGNDPTNGFYVPSWPGDGGHFWLGDTVTIHTGTGELDYNNQSIRVAAIEWVMDPAGLWDVWVELGSTFLNFNKPGTGTLPGTTLPPTQQPCDCGPVPGPVCVNTGITGLVSWTWDGSAAATYRLPSALALDGINHDILGPAGTPLSSSGEVTHGDEGTTFFDWVTNDAGFPPIKCSPGDVIDCNIPLVPYWNEYSGYFGVAEVTWFASGGSIISSEAFGPTILSTTYDGSHGAWRENAPSTPAAPALTAGFSVRYVPANGSGTRPGGRPTNGRTYFRDQWRFSVAGSSDPLCIPALIYGTSYDPSTGLPGYYIPFGSTVPAPTAAVIPYDPALFPSNIPALTVQGAIDNLDSRVDTLEGEVAAPTSFLTNKGGEKHVVADLGDVSGSIVLNVPDANIFKFRMVGDCTLEDPVGWDVAYDGAEIAVDVSEDSTGGWVLTIGGSIVAPASGFPTLPTDPDTVSGFGLRTNDGGATVLYVPGPGSGLTVKDEGTPLATSASLLDFVGAGVTASGAGANKTITIPGGASALDDLTDVAITSPADADRLRYDAGSGLWKNSSLKWTPVTVYDPTTGNYLPAVDGSGNSILTEV